MIREGVPLSSAEYVERLAGQLSANDAHNLLASGLFDAHRVVLEEAASDADGGELASSTGADSGSEETAVVQLWRRFDAGLRGEIGRLRAAARKIGADPHWPQMDSFIYIEELRRIFQQVDPMKRELQTHDLRWDFLEELSQAWSGQLGGAIVYYLKLQLLERLQTMEHKRAHHALSAIYARCHTQFQEKIGRLTAKSTTEEAEALS